MFNQKMITVKMSKISDFKVIRFWFSLGMCVLVLFLNSASGTSEADLAIVTAQPASPTIEDVFKTMKLIGCTFNNKIETLLIRPYIPIPPAEPGIDAVAELALSTPNNPVQDNVPSYMIEYNELSITIDLPDYPNIDSAKEALTELRKIAVIKMPATQYVSISYTVADPICHHINLQILSRLVNMFVGPTIEISLHPNQKNKAPPTELVRTACQEEAQNTIRHGAPESACQRQFSTTKNSKLQDLLISGIFVLRPIYTVFLDENEVQNTPLLIHLPLKTNYIVAISSPPKVVEIDCGFLQAINVECSRIIIDGPESTKITLTGLENATTRHPALALHMDCDTFRCLYNHNTTQVKVHTLSGLNITPESEELFYQGIQNCPFTKLWLDAIKVVSKVSKRMPCRSLAQHREYYTQESLIHYGLLVEEVDLNYEGQRDDLYQTLQVFCNICALSAMPIDVHNKSIICQGGTLCDNNWMLQERVCIQLEHPDLSFWLKRYQDKHAMCFCQNIRYRAIEIKGDECPRDNQTKDCIGLLKVFRSITAQELKITNICNNNETASDFNLDTLITETTKGPKYSLDVKILILDNVDISIIYWILGHYDLDGPIEIHILNQHFTNLAITQILAFSKAQNVKALVINDFLELDEVKYHKHPDQIQEFSLFKHVATAIQANKTVQSLGLDKLSLLLGKTDFSLHNDVLEELCSYGIQIRSVLFDAYLACTAMNPKQASIANKDEFALYDINLMALKTDYAQCHAKSLLQSSSTQSQESLIQKQSLNSLTLHFSDNQSITEESLVTIVRWVSCRFVGVATLRLASVEIPEQERKTIASRAYLIRDLELLNSIQLETTDASHSYIELLSQSYHNNSVVNFPNPNSEFTAVSSTMLLSLHNQLDSLNDLIPEHANNNASLQKIITHLKNNKNDVGCPICFQGLVIPQKGEQEDDVPPAKRFCPVFVPTEDLTMLCFFKCGHPVCHTCMPNVQKTNKCPTCMGEKMWENVHQLISIPLSSVVFAKDDSEVPFANPKWLEAITWHDGQVYFYLHYKDIPDLLTNLNSHTTYGEGHRIHII
ncbi:hypothetical protein NEHOM01_0165 [Nematocida homosporus]|uniref:uncharacterized protein n=1 Tax=Nematocida homosporus TaxID=1912981 RepID=UPI002220CCE5|nr:uncharacterized protein NEHOM01_0165 [Nematocida homosporus]KAI5184420.1 hypothetical protein NEHOM01_0165 [Nematocida homosporus]